MANARVVYRDLHYNRNLGLNGISSCQELRAAFPNALPDYVMGRSALDLSVSFDALAEEYYTAAYGSEGLKLLPLMDEISSLFSSDYVLNYVPRVRPELAERMRRVPALLDQIQTLMDSRQPDQHPVQAHMWSEIGFFLEYTRILARATELAADDHPEEARDVYENEFKPLVRGHEMVDQSGLDVFRVCAVLDYTFRKDRP